MNCLLHQLITCEPVLNLKLFLKYRPEVPKVFSEENGNCFVLVTPLGLAAYFACTDNLKHLITIGNKSDLEELSTNSRNKVKSTPILLSIKASRGIVR
jgi:hypothetical protein